MELNLSDYSEVLFFDLGVLNIFLKVVFNVLQLANRERSPINLLLKKS